MKIIKKIIPLTLTAVTLFGLSGCIKDEEIEEMKKNTVHEKNPIVTMNIAYQTAEGEDKEGTVKIELYPNEAPETVNNFVNLVQNGFYNNLKFHRIIDGFMIQGGDPLGNGTGSATVSDIDKTVNKGSDQDYAYSIKGEFDLNDFETNLKFEPGTIAMARADYTQLGMQKEGYDSACSQFFIVNTDNVQAINALEGSYAAFGKVIEGYDVIQEISKVKVKQNTDSGELSAPEKAPIIKSITVDTFGEEYDKPELINADEVSKKVNETYTKLMQKYYQY